MRSLPFSLQLSPRVSSAEAHEKFVNHSPDARLSALESHLRDLVAMGQARDHESFDQRDALTHVKQLSDRILVEVQGVARRVDEGKVRRLSSCGLSRSLVDRKTDSRTGPTRRPNTRPRSPRSRRACRTSPRRSSPRSPPRPPTHPGSTAGSELYSEDCWSER